MTTQAIQWYANRLKEQELGIRTNELNVRKGELDETQRHNYAAESENYRHNVAQEEYNRQQVEENQRHNLAVEQDYGVQREEQARHNLAVESETNRSNLRQEELKDESNKATVKAAAIRAAGSSLPSLAKLFTGKSSAGTSGDDLNLWNYMATQGATNSAPTGVSALSPVVGGVANFIAGSLLVYPVVKAVMSTVGWDTDEGAPATVGQRTMSETKAKRRSPLGVRKQRSY